MPCHRISRASFGLAMILGLNITELFVGFCIQIPFYYLLGLWFVPLGIVSSLLWALGGANFGNKAIRRYGVPASTIVALIAFKHAFLILAAYIPAVLVLSLGYGEKSWLWCAIYRFNGNRLVADYCTRMITYIAYWAIFGVALIFCK